MANVVAELFVTLGIDGSAVNKQLEKTEGDMKSLGERAHKVGDQIRTGLTNEFYNLVKAAFPFASVTASLVALTKAHQGLYNIEKASREIGIPSQEYAAWGRAAEALGYSAQDAQSSIASLQTSLQEAALTGRSQAAGVLTYLGVSLFKANGQMKTAGETLKDLSKVLSKMPIEKARIYGQMMGLSPSTIALLREGKNLTNELSEALKNGPSAEDAKRAWEVQKSWNQLTQAGGDLAREMFVALAPAFELITDLLKIISKAIKDNPFFIKLAASVAVVATLTAGVTKLASAFVLLGGVASKAIVGLAGLMKANPMIVGITLALAGLLDVFNLMRGESSFIGTFFESLGVKSENLKAVFQAITDVILFMLKPLGWLIDGIGALLNLNPKDVIEKRGEGAQSPSELIASYQGGIRDVSRDSMVAPSIVTQNRNMNRTSNTEINNQVTINAPGGNPRAVEKAAMTGINSGLSGLRDLTAFRESGFESK